MSAAPDANLIEAQRWLRQGQEHLLAAEHCAKGQFLGEACFWCQQAAELALKALLIRQGERARVHGLLYLVERLAAAYPDIKTLSDLARSLDRFYIPTRYPDMLPRGTTSDYFSDQDYADAHAAAAAITAFAQQELTQP